MGVRPPILREVNNKTDLNTTGNALNGPYPFQCLLPGCLLGCFVPKRNIQHRGKLSYRYLLLYQRCIGVRCVWFTILNVG